MGVSPAPFTCDGTHLGHAESRRQGIRGGQWDTEVGIKDAGRGQGMRWHSGSSGGWVGIGWKGLLKLGQELETPTPAALTSPR